MELFLYVELNIVAIILLMVIFIHIYHQSEPFLTEQKLFLGLLGSTGLLLITDSLIKILDGRTEFLIKPIYLVLLVVYHILTPSVCMFWAYYADYLVVRNKKRLKLLTIPLLIPFLGNAVLSILSIFDPLLFYIDVQNISHRGTIYFATAIISTFYLLYTFILLIKNRHKVHKEMFISILTFPIPPAICGLIQLAFPTICMIWISITLSILIIFINLQNDHQYRDYLTRLFNRRQLDYYLKERIQKKLHKQLLAGIMIDLSSLKQINDKYGHSMGDQALKDTARVLKNTFHKQDFIARYGGDEFVIILEVADSTELIKAVNKFKENVTSFNQSKTTPYEINYSIGVDYYNPKSYRTSQDFLKRIDHLMCQDKKEKLK